MIFNFSYFFLRSVEMDMKDAKKMKYEMKENYEIKSSFKDRFEL
jgi:hypothetical protein